MQLRSPHDLTLASLGNGTHLRGSVLSSPFPSARLPASLAILRISQRGILFLPVANHDTLAAGKSLFQPPELLYVFGTALCEKLFKNLKLFCSFSEISPPPPGFCSCKIVFSHSNGVRSNGFTKKNPGGQTKEMKAALSDIKLNIDSVQCNANILVTAGDRCWREERAVILLELSSSGEWCLVVKNGSHLGIFTDLVI
ncbi:hypothetical protein KSP40_PGU002314 [Platanthera guangdongensis]|uniref:Uncharacterized protein n=1 Tax=Platanthera guangdongensis TaxID=2320717 RepID=A0ABR2LY02_9ASPA